MTSPAESRWLDAPWRFVDLQPGESVTLFVARIEIGRTPPADGRPAASWPFETSRLHLDPTRHPAGPAYYDVIGRKVASTLSGLFPDPLPAVQRLTLTAGPVTWPPSYSLTRRTL